MNRWLCFVLVVLFPATLAHGQIQRRPFESRSSSSNGATRFSKLDPNETGLNVRGRLDWKHRLGFLFFSNGAGGVAVGDVDGNGLPDIFLVEGADANRLMLQVRPWIFRDATKSSGLANLRDDDCGGDGWGMGATLLDIDNDQDLDLYVVNYDSPNFLFVNDGKGNFEDQAAHYGLNLVGPTTMASFCDYDRDGDLDIYLVNNRFMDEKEMKEDDVFFFENGQYQVTPEASRYFSIFRHDEKPSWQSMWIGQPDRLMTNQGVGKPFKDDSAKLGAGGASRGDGLSATWWDYDHDGWPDLYVCNDLASPDRLYHNNGDGTFTDSLLKSIPHAPWFAMGSCAGDINNDGLVDFLAADMAFRTHYKDKVFMGNMGTKFDSIEYFPATQLMRNALYLNTGTPRFQEAAFLTGLASTEWTWTTSLGDFDNDGRLDAYFTNGTPVNMQAPEPPKASVISTGRIRKQYQDQDGMKETNLAFRNLGGLAFEEVGAEWGLAHEGMSFTAVHCDLDRDGDLDVICWDLNEPVSLYRNDSQTGNSVTIQLVGTVSNSMGIGAEVRVVTETGEQVRQVYPVAGFKGCHESMVHFGLGDQQTIQSLQVDWPSGHRTFAKDLDANKHYRVREAELTNSKAFRTAPLQPLFKPVSSISRVTHKEDPFDDFARQPLLPNQLSQLGPGMAWGDVNGDGRDDLFLAGAAGWSGGIYLNRGDAKLEPSRQVALADHASSEDMGGLFLDVDGDSDLDLYVASGGVECESDDPRLQDRLYLNDGAGNFVDATREWLPTAKNSSQSIAACDFDKDGDVDLLVTSRSIPGQYPLAPTHHLLRHEGDHFVIHDKATLALQAAGMVTSAVWTDVDADGWSDLLLATDWGPIRLFKNDKGTLIDQTDGSGLAKWSGWWNSITPLDADGDGDMDYAVGNFGLNTKYHATRDKPVYIYYGDYGDGQPHLLEAEYEENTLYPMRGKSCSSRAMPFLKDKFKTYEQFAVASLTDIYTPKCIEQAQKFTVNTLESGCMINDGQGRFEFRPFPRVAQIAPVFGIVSVEVNGDGIQDLFLAQNFYQPQKETGPMDGGVGLVMLGREDGTFQPVRTDVAGIVVPTDMRAATSVDLNQDGWADLCVATNNGPIYAFERQPPKADGQGTSLRILGSRRNPGSLGAIVDVVGATKQRLEVSSNSGYLSQSSPQICLGALPNGSPDETVATVRWSDGKQEKVRLESGKLNTITHPEHRPSNGDGLSLARSQAKHREWLALNLELAQDFQLNGDIESAMRTIRRVIGGAPENPAGYLIYANLLRQQKRYREARDVVAKLYQAGGQGSPEVLMTGGRILHELERYDEAMAQYQLAVKIAPERQDLKLVVADTLVAQGRLRSAIAMLSSVKDPTAPVKQKLAKVRGRIDSIREKLRASRELMKTDTPAAMKSYAQVLALDGDSLESLNNLAWHHATHPDSAQRNGWRAVRYAERAKRITGGKNASVLDTLSAAYAEAGDFGKAIETVKEVLASSKTSEKQKASSQTKLEAYLKRQPIRTEQ